MGQFPRHEDMELEVFKWCSAWRWMWWNIKPCFIFRECYVLPIHKSFVWLRSEKSLIYGVFSWSSKSEHKSSWYSVVIRCCRHRAGSITSIAVNLAYLLSILISPYMPTVATTIRTQLGISEDQHVLEGTFVRFLPDGHEIGKVWSRCIFMYAVVNYISTVLTPYSPSSQHDSFRQWYTQKYQYEYGCLLFTDLFFMFLCVYYV